MRIPYSIKGALFGPIMIALTVALKAACPLTLGDQCFADYLAVPIFLPLILIYRIVRSGLIMYHEFWFVILYWSIAGLLIGLIFDLRKGRSQY